MKRPCVREAKEGRRFQLRTRDESAHPTPRRREALRRVCHIASVGKGGGTIGARSVGVKRKVVPDVTKSHRCVVAWSLTVSVD